MQANLKRAVENPSSYTYFPGMEKNEQGRKSIRESFSGHWKDTGFLYKWEGEPLEGLNSAKV